MPGVTGSSPVSSTTFPVTQGPASQSAPSLCLSLRYPVFHSCYHSASQAACTRTITGSTTSRTRAPEAACPTRTSVGREDALVQLRLAVGLAPRPQAAALPGAPAETAREGCLARRSLPP